MIINQFKLFFERRFMPLFITQFLGALNDNLFKNGFVALILFGSLTVDADSTALYTTIAAGLFIFPFILFSGYGGQLADKYAKNDVIRSIKTAEILVSLSAMIALYLGNIYGLYLVLFLYGMQSAFFGPSKYAILPQHLDKEELIAGNALLNTGTFLAILIGTLCGVLIIGLKAGALLLGFALLICSIIGYLTALMIPDAPPKSLALQFKINPVTEIYDVLKLVFKQTGIVKSAFFGVAWFYFLGGLFMAQLPNYTKDSLNGDQSVLALLLVIFSVGIALGGLINNRLLGGQISAKFVPYALLGISLASIDLFYATLNYVLVNTESLNIEMFINFEYSWRILIDLAVIAVLGGLYVVPLNALIQYHIDGTVRARVISGGAILNAFFIVLSSFFAVVLIAQNWTIEEIFRCVGIICIFLVLVFKKTFSD